MTIRKKNSNHFDGVAVVIVLVVVVAQVWPRQGPRATNGSQSLFEWPANNFKKFK